MTLGNKGFWSLTSGRPAALDDQDIELAQPPGKKRRWSPACAVSHRYRVYPGTCKRSVSRRVPTHFRPVSPCSRRKTICFQRTSPPADAKVCPQTACMDASRSARAFFVDPAHQVSCCHVYGLVEVTKTAGLDGIRDRLLNKLASLLARRGNQVLPIPVRPMVPSRR